MKRIPNIVNPADAVTAGADNAEAAHGLDGRTGVDLGIVLAGLHNLVAPCLQPVRGMWNAGLLGW